MVKPQMCKENCNENQSCQPIKILTARLTPIQSNKLERIGKFRKAGNLYHSADNPAEIEQRIISSIFARWPKRADVYWFIHIYHLT